MTFVAPPKHSDAELLAQWADGERRAGAELFDRYFGPISRFFRHKVSGTLQEQDDLVQTTFTSCLSAAPRFRGEGSVRSFLFSIAYNVLRRHYEHRARDARVDFGTVSIHDLAPRPSTALGRKAEVAVLIAAMRRLPVELQTALELHYWEETTVAEIAVVLELPVGTVKSRLRRARTLLAALVTEQLGRHTDGFNERLDPDAVLAALTPTRKYGSGSAIPSESPNDSVVAQADPPDGYDPDSDLQ